MTLRKESSPSSLKAILLSKVNFASNKLAELSGAAGDGRLIMAPIKRRCPPSMHYIYSDS